MSYLARIEPSGHSFTVLPEETLLEAALRSGMNVKYSCNNGSCGDCKVRLLAGEVVPAMPASYHFTTQQQNEGFILLCSNHPASDVVFEGQEALTPSDIPLQSLTAKVSKVESHGPHVRILHLRTPRTKTLRFMAGQHICLKLPGVGSYDAAIASCPCNGMNLQFHLPERSGEPFIDALFGDKIRIGTKLELEGPYGDTSLDDDSSRPLLMLAMGTEIAPIKSLIEHAINLDLQQPIRLIWLSSRDEGHYLENHCRAWAEVLDDYRFTTLTMAGHTPVAEDIVALKQVIEEQLPGFDEVDAYIAGSNLFREVVREHLLTLGLDSERVFSFHHRNVVRPGKLSARG